MIITCPACQTRYTVAAEAVSAPRGRKVRCASCGHVWFYRPDAAAAPAKPEEKPSPPSPLPPLRADPDAPLVAAPVRRRPPAVPKWAVLAAVLLVFAIVVTGVLARNRIARAWPAAAHFYQALGIRVRLARARLVIRHVAPVRSGDELIVEGEITNTGDTELTVPHLRVALRDAYNNELAAKVIDPPTAQLAPGAVAHFSATFGHPSVHASGVAVTFIAG